ncbi:MAG: ceramide glucosyltransferase [Alphaproteobacteria bacterium]|nr:ceramide glucosyltransferase [Alphaproteobacteria bacterium]
MEIVFWLALTVCAMLSLIHLSTIFVAIARCRPHEAAEPLAYAASVTLIRPLCGVDNYCVETLRSSFALDYARYDILFCVANGKDPVVPLVERLIAEHPGVSARLLIGDERISRNPKLNNICKGWEAASGEWVIIADSNVLMPPDYVQRLLGAWLPDTGLVCSPPIGCLPSGLWGELECAFLNTYQARWQYFADSVGLGFAQGKTMLWRREDLNRAGGLRALAQELAEDAASTKVVRDAGMRVRLVDCPFGQPLGRRSMGEVWKRQLRWARLRRDSFKTCYALELLSSSLLPMLAGGVAAAVVNASPLGGAALAGAIWYGGEALLAYAARWPLSLHSPLAWLLRDALLIPLWVAGWFGNDIVWRGNQMDLAEDVFLGAAAERE